MKFIIDYDLLEKVNHANGNMNIRRMISEEMKTQIVIYGFYTAMDILSRRDDGIQWGTNLMICSGFLQQKLLYKVFMNINLRMHLNVKLV